MCHIKCKNAVCYSQVSGRVLPICSVYYWPTTLPKVFIPLFLNVLLYSLHIMCTYTRLQLENTMFCHRLILSKAPPPSPLSESNARFFFSCVLAFIHYILVVKKLNIIHWFSFVLAICVSWNVSKYHKLSLKCFSVPAICIPCFFFRNERLMESNPMKIQRTGKSRWQWLVESSVRTGAGNCPEFDVTVNVM